ncbi:MAG: 50S ribosomal protein L4 [Bacilli bacterium]|jgi:large subunit ribosomal protein L4|nr:50S ribosomal protein L4 [Bacilli bacterium]
MTKVNVIDLKGSKVKDITVNDEIFKIEGNDIVLKKAIRLQMDSLRQGTASTKGRSDVSGGGRKPYRQKGTGNARQGTIRAPHYRGGGVVFGPTPRSYSFKMNRKERRLALKTALSDKMAENKFIVVESLELASTKTKDAIKLLETLKLEGKVLFVSSHDAEKLYLATRNLGTTAVIMADELNVYDIVNADVIVCDCDTVNYIEEALK